MDNNLYSIFFSSRDTGYVVGDSGIILKTSDEGTKWTIQNSGTFQNLFSVFFTDSDTGYAVGDSGLILKTNNGGANWIIQTSGTTQRLNSVYCTDANTCYAVGERGIILKTSNGGTSGINKNYVNKNAIKIYPNPFSNSLILEMPDFHFSDCDVFIFDIFGKKIYQSQVQSTHQLIDLSSHPKGIYFVRVQSGAQLRMNKIILQ